MKNIQLFYGDDEFSIRKRASQIASELKAEKVVFGGDVNLLVNRLLSGSFFSQKRLFVCENYLFGLTEEEVKKLTPALKKIPPDTWVLFLEKKRPKAGLENFFKKNGGVSVFNKPTSRDLIGFINERVAREEGRILPLAAERLATFVGPDYWQLEEEIKKLVLYRKGNPEDSAIQTSDVDLLVRSNFEASIFELMDAIASKNHRKSIKLLNKFLDSGENEIYIFFMIVKQFRNIAMAKFEDRISESALAKRAGLHPYVAKKSISQARSFEKAEIINIYKRLREADLALKSGSDPKRVLESLVI